VRWITGHYIRKSEMENIATEISYGDGRGGSNETANVGFRPLVNVRRNSRCQQSSINSVSHQGLDNGIRSVHKCGIYRMNLKRTSSPCEPTLLAVEGLRHQPSD
jgi:hypothetical protein